MGDDSNEDLITAVFFVFCFLFQPIISLTILTFLKCSYVMFTLGFYQFLHNTMSFVVLENTLTTSTVTACWAEIFRLFKGSAMSIANTRFKTTRSLFLPICLFWFPWRPSLITACYGRKLLTRLPAQALRGHTGHSRQPNEAGWFPRNTFPLHMQIITHISEPYICLPF